MGADLEDGEIEDGEIQDEEICEPKVTPEISVETLKRVQAPKQQPQTLLRQNENIVTEDDWAGDVEKAIMAAMATTKPATTEGKEGVGEVDTGDHKGKRKKRKKRTKDGDEEEHKETKKRKKSHGSVGRNTEAAGEDPEQEGEDEGDDDEEMLYVRGASPVQHSPMHGVFQDDSFGYVDASGGPFDDQYESGYEDSDYEEFVRSRRGEDEDGAGQGLGNRGRGCKRRQSAGRGRGMQSKGRGLKEQTLKGGKRPGGKRHVQRNTMMQDTRQQGPDSICMFYMQGKCQKGEECPYSHNALPPRKMELCKFYLMDCCAKKDKCLYMHSDFPCKFFHTGLKCFAGDRCKFSHGPLTDTLRAILLKVGHTALDHLETAPKEILGDFPRLSREGAAAMVYNKKGRGKGPIPGKKIPSLFEIQVPIPPQLLAQRMLNSESGDDDGSPLGNCNHGATPMPSDNEDDETNMPVALSPKLEYSTAMKKSPHKWKNHWESTDLEPHVDHVGSGDEGQILHTGSEDGEPPLKRPANHDTANDHISGRPEKVKPRFYQETLSSTEEIAASPEHHHGRHHRQRHKRSKSKAMAPRTKHDINLHRLAGYSPSVLASDSDEGSHQPRIIRAPSPPSMENSLAAAAVKLDPPLNLTEDEGKLEIVDGQDSDQDSHGHSTPQSYSKHQEIGIRKEHADTGDSNCSLEVGIPANLPKKQRELFLRIQQQQREAADSSSQEQEDDAHGNEEGNALEENWYSSDDEEASLTDVLKNLQQQQTKEQQQHLQPQRSKTPPLSMSSPAVSVAFTSSAAPPVFKLGALSSINISESVSKLLSSIRNSSAVNIPQTPGSVTEATKTTSTPPPASNGGANLTTSEKDPRLSHGTATARDPRLVSRDPRNRVSVLLSPSSSSNADPRTKPVDEPRPASRSVRRSSSTSFTSIYSSAITLPLTSSTASERQIGSGDTDLRSYLPPAISDIDLRQSLSRYGDTDLRTGTSDVDLRGMLSLPFKPVPMHTPATEIDASLNSHPPILYKVVSISVPRPDYSGLKLTISDPQVRSDPRLRKLFKISSSTPSTTTITATTTATTLSPASPPSQQSSPLVTQSTQLKQSPARTDPRRRSMTQAQQQIQPPVTAPGLPLPQPQQPSVENMGLLQTPSISFPMEQPHAMMKGGMILDPRRRNNAPGLLGPAPGIAYSTALQIPPVLPCANFDMSGDGAKSSVDMDLRPTGHFFPGTGVWNPEQQKMMHQQHRGRNWQGGGGGLRRGTGHSRFQHKQQQQQPDRSYTPPL